MSYEDVLTDNYQVLVSVVFLLLRDSQKLASKLLSSRRMTLPVDVAL